DHEVLFANCMSGCSCVRHGYSRVAGPLLVVSALPRFVGSAFNQLRLAGIAGRTRAQPLCVRSGNRHRVALHPGPAAAELQATLLPFGDMAWPDLRFPRCVELPHYPLLVPGALPAG